MAFAGRLADGSLVVVDRGSGEIRWFHTNGEHGRTIGGRGEGPGEFGEIGDAWLLPGDTLLVLDDRLQRVTYIGPDGEVDRVVSVRGLYELMDPDPFIVPDGAVLGRVAPDRYVVGFSSDVGDRLSGAADGDTLLIPYHVLLSDPEADVVDTVAVLPSTKRRVHSYDPPDGAATVTQATPYPEAVTGAVQVAVGPGELTVARSDHYELRRFEADGTPAAAVRRRDLEPKRMDRSVLQQLEEAYRDLNTDPDEMDLHHLLGDPLPSLGGVLYGAEGEVWVRGPDATYPPFHERRERSPEHVVFAPDGRPTGTAHISTDLRVTHIGGGYVTGVVRDDLSVETVVVYELVPREEPVLLPGCGEEAFDGPSSFNAFDSAGVRIAESAVPTWGPDEGWEVSADPALGHGRHLGHGAGLLRVRRALSLRAQVFS